MNPAERSALSERVREFVASGDHAAAERLLGEACEAPGAGAADWLELAHLRLNLRQPGPALVALGHAGALDPGDPAIANAAAQALQALGRTDDAITRLRQQLVRTPDDATTRANLGWLEELSGRADAALIAYDRALVLDPGLDRARLNRASMHLRAGRAEAALPDYDVLVARLPGAAGAWYNRAECHARLSRHADAAADCERALELEPRHTGARLCRAVALASLGEVEPAQALFDAVWAEDPGAVARYAGHAEVAPAPPDARSVHVYQGFNRLRDADWSGYDALTEALERYAADPDGPPDDLSMAYPAMYAFISPPASARIHAAISASFARTSPAPPARQRAAGEPLRVGYVSSKFGPTPSNVMTSGLFSAHDRNRVTVSAYAISPDDGSPERAAVAANADCFVDLSRLDDEAAAARIRADGVDVLVDLIGFSNEARPGLWARRPAGVQVTFLGHAHSLHAPWVDYRMTDRIAEPVQDSANRTAKVPEARAFLPASFYVFDERRAPRTPAPPRAALGLPRDAMVYACFNRVEKLEPRVFDAWMAILARVDGAVLWLLDPGKRARANLEREAGARGIAPARLVFAPRTDHGAHLNRQQAADLLLDTFAHGSHTTGLEGLHAGVPLLTLGGDTLSRRIGSSLVIALDEPSLRTGDGAEYVAAACAFAADPARLGSVRTRIATRIRENNPFATARIVAYLERAYGRMAERHALGERPVDFDV